MHAYSVCHAMVCVHICGYTHALCMLVWRTLCVVCMHVYIAMQMFVYISVCGICCIVPLCACTMCVNVSCACMCGTTCACVCCVACIWCAYMHVGAYTCACLYNMCTMHVHVFWRRLALRGTRRPLDLTRALALSPGRLPKVPRAGWLAWASDRRP